MKLRLTLALCVLFGLVAIAASSAIANRLATAGTTMFTVHPSASLRVADNSATETNQAHSSELVLDSGNVTPNSAEVYRGWQGLQKLHYADIAGDPNVICLLP